MNMYKCDADCGYTSKNWFGLCPRCKNGFGSEVEEIKSSSNSKNVKKERPNYEVNKVSKNNTKDKIAKVTKYSSLNKVISSQGGIIEGQVIILGSMPGTGKSTLCCEISDNDTIYISSEESYNQVNSRFLRVNPETSASIISTTDIDVILDIIETRPETFVIIDSLNSINNGMDSYVRQFQNMYKITEAIKRNNKSCIVISQVTKGGEVAGYQALSHTADSIFYLERSQISSNIIFSSTKNRFGEIGSVAIFEHYENGLEEISEDIHDDNPQPGTSFTKAKFGYRKMTVCIEALVAPSSLNYGLRKSNGINVNRLHQILGIISYNSRIDFSNKDIYLSVSNGLTVNDFAVDVAIANSILSSYYNKPSKFKTIEGQLSLNGSIKGCSDLNHIKDLIDLYK